MRKKIVRSSTQKKNKIKSELLERDGFQGATEGNFVLNIAIIKIEIEKINKKIYNNTSKYNK